MLPAPNNWSKHPSPIKTLQRFLSTQTEVEEYVNAVYASLQTQSLYGLYLPAIGEVSSDNAYEEVPGNDGSIYYQLDVFTVSPQNQLITDVWTGSYQAIQKANVVLNRIDKITYADPALKNARIGEMKFIRALLYFNLVRLYGDVPLVTKETADPNVYFGQGRQKAADVYTQIKTDLTDAIAVLPATTSQPGRVIKTAAQSLLGKVYLTLIDYANAKTQLQAVVASGQHALQASVNTVFPIANENNKEIIFAVQFAAGINGNSEGSTMAQQYSPAGSIANAKGHDLPTKTLYNLYTTTDARKGVYVTTFSNGTPYCNKWTKNTAVPADGGSDFPVIRYADVLLMLAEVENELGNTATAIPYLNQVRTRAGATAATATTQPDARAAIALERQLELVGEGQRWYDLLRTGTAVAVMNAWFAANTSPIVITTDNLLMPVPQTERNTDPTLTQNPGYPN